MPPPTSVEVIEITYKAVPPGQIGPRPKVLTAGARLSITTEDDGEMEIEFKGASPLANGQTKVAAGRTVQAAVPGHYRFKCRLKRAGQPDIVLDPDDPNLPGGGGEMKILPDGN